MTRPPLEVHWWQRLYVRNYLVLFANLLFVALMFLIAWHLREQGVEHRNPVLLVVLLVVLALAAAIGAFPMVRRLTGRLERLQRGVEAFGAGELSARVAVEGRDEVASLAASFNRSAALIEVLLNSQKTLLSNASHELRSPLARIRMAVELMQDRAQPELRHELMRSMAELDQLIDEILLASRLDAVPDAVLNAEDLDFTALVAEECARVDARLQAETVSLIGDAKLLRRMLRNLLENAQRHGQGTAIEVSLALNGKQEIQLDITDHGPGIPAVECENIFTAFYRLPGSSEGAGSVGLGLSLVRQIALAHGGTAQCLPNARAGGFFRVLLPTR